jgi:hypothetical protein
MTRGMESLLSVLREGEDVSTLLPAQLQEAFDRAEVERVLPFFLFKLRSADFALPQEFDLRCAAAEREITISNFWWISQVKAILQALAAEFLQVILLKGPSMAERLYGGTNLRTSRDIDLLVRHRDLAIAGDIFTALGFIRGIDDEGRHQTWMRGATMVELHFDLICQEDLCIDLDRIFANLTPVTFAGQPAYVLSPSDELLFLCVHGIKHSYEQLCYILDVALAIEKWGTPSACAVRAGDIEFVAPILELGYAMARKLYSLEISAELTLNSKAAIRIDRVSESLWSRFSESLSTQNFRCSPRRLFFILRPTRVAQVRYLLYVLGANSREDRALAARFHIGNQGLIACIRKLRLAFKSVCRGGMGLSKAL